MINFYKLLDIERGASEEEIQKAIRQTRRKWTPRQNNPNSEIRAEAEKTMHDIAEAERILLNAEKRAEYNLLLDETPYQAPEVSSKSLPNQSEGDGSDWYSRAQELLDNEYYDALYELLEKITEEQPENHLAWYILGLGKAQDGYINDAIDCLLHTTAINRDFAMQYDVFNFLGMLFYAKSEFEEAEYWYAEATKQNDKYRICLADAQNRRGKYSEALATASVVYENSKDDEVKKIYARCLRDHSYQSLSVDKLNNIYEITNIAQLNYMKGKISAFEELLPSGSTEVQNIVAEAKKMISDAEYTRVSVGAIIFYVIVVVVLFGLFPVANIVAIPLFCYFVYEMYQPHYKLSKSTVDRRTGLQP